MKYELTMKISLTQYRMTIGHLRIIFHVISSKSEPYIDALCEQNQGQHPQKINEKNKIFIFDIFLRF